MDRKQLADEIRAKVSIVDVVSQYVKLTRAGSNHKGLCPFHNEATPSFLVSEDKGIYKCFGCSEGGDAISFLSKMEGITYSDALSRLAIKSGTNQMIIRNLQKTSEAYNFDKELKLLKFVQGFYQYYLINTQEGIKALEYLEGRGISKTIVDKFGIGLAPVNGDLLIKALETNGYSFEVAIAAGVIGQRDQGDYYPIFKSRITFQITNEQGSVIGFSGRVYLPQDAQKAKYVNSPESKVFQKSHIIYNLNEAKKESRTSKTLLLFEGFLDVIATYRAGLTGSVATMGTALTMQHAKKLRMHAREVVLVFDGDSAGVLATSKAIPILLLAGLQVRVVIMPDGVDPDDYMSKFGTSRFVNLIQNAVGAMDFQYEFLKQGLNLNTTDHQAEFNRRLMEFSNQLPDKSMQQLLLQKFKNEVYETKSNSSQGLNRQEGLYRKTNKNVPSVPVSKLKVEAGEVKAEKELIYYMLIDKRVFVQVIEQIGTSFNMDVHRRIVQAIEAYYYQQERIELLDFIEVLDNPMKRVVQEIIYELKNRPRTWSNQMIEELISKIIKGAIKLERAGKKELFYKASHEQQLVMMSDLTANAVY